MSQQPRSRADHNCLEQALAALRRRQAGQALELVEAVLERRPQDIDALRLAARCQEQLGRGGQALRLQERAIAAAPGQPELVVEASELARRGGDYDAAVKLAETALGGQGDHAGLLLSLARTRIELGDLELGASLLERAADAAPGNASVKAWLAYVREQANSLEQAESLAKDALELDPGQPLARLVRARLLLRGGAAEACLKMVEPLLSEGTLGAANMSLAHQLRAQALDRLGRMADAYAAFSESNRVMRTFGQRQSGRMRGPFSPESLRLLRQRAGSRPATFQPAADPRPPVFLVGFPRSGTTLLDQMLDSHPEIVTLEERDPLRALHDGFLPPSGDPGNLPGLSIEQRLELRDAYWRRVSHWTGDRGGRLLVDKLPMNSALLPAIAHVFPDAPVIVSLRDPRDVCLSCFMQSFGLNDATVNMLSMASTCNYYALVMGGLIQDMNRLAMRFHRIRYEDLLEQPETQLRGLCRFLGVDWDDALLNYRETAAGRAINTPSYSQVQQPLYRSAVGRWRRYADLIAEEIRVLEPMVSAFGYEDS